MEIISRKEAKEQGLKFYFTGEPCPHGHVAPRYVSSRGCTECANAAQTASRRALDGVELSRVEGGAVFTSRAAARKAGANRYFTGKACPNGHVADRYTLNGGCVDCKIAWRLDNPEYQQEYEAEHREVLNAQAKDRRNKNPEAFKKRIKKYREKPEVKARLSDAAKIRQRRMTIEVPPWADKEIIEFFYSESRRLTLETGIKHVVDHMIPIDGEGVSGLHVETNLQVMTDRANVSKRNKYSQDG